MIRISPRCVKKDVVLSLEDPIYADLEMRFIGSCSVGAYTFFGQGCLIAQCTIGRFCSIAPNVTIGLGEHPINMFSTHPLVFGAHKALGINKGLGGRRGEQKPPPIIGNDVWIGANVTILRGVKIGDGAVVGAGSVVSKDVAPYSVVGGLPAKEIKKRFPEEVAFRLMATEWWNYDIGLLRGIDFSEIEKSICDIEARLSDQTPRAYEQSELRGQA